MLAAGGGLAALALMPRDSFADTGVPVIPYDSVPNPVHLPPDLYLGECSGVALNSKGHVFVLSRGNTEGPALCRRPELSFWNSVRNGRFIREIGHHLYAWSSRAHGQGRSARQHLG